MYVHGVTEVDLDHIEENSEDLNIFVPLLNQLILKSNIANNVLYFFGICQQSLKSKQHMANHVGGASPCSGSVSQLCRVCSLFSHKNNNHKIQKKDAPEIKNDAVQKKSELLPAMTETLQTKAEAVQNRPEFTPRKNEDVQNIFNNAVNMSEHIDTHNAEETANHYSSEAEFE